MNTPSEIQVSITKAVLNALMITNQIFIIKQQLNSNGRHGRKFVTTFEIENYNSSTDGEVGTFILEVMKNGKTKILQFQDASFCRCQPIHDYFSQQ